MDKTYNPKTIEKRIYKSWEDAGYFAPSKKGDSIVIPTLMKILLEGPVIRLYSETAIVSGLSRRFQISP